MTPRPTTYVAVDLDAIAHNLAQVLARLSEASSLCAVVKANAYGHGAVPVAQRCVEAGAAWLATSTVAEGVALREAGIAAPTLVFMPPLGDECAAAVAHDLTVTVTGTQQVMELQREGERQGRIAQAHVYDEEGLGRLGSQEMIVDIAEAAEPWPHVWITGVYTHFGPPGSGDLVADLALGSGTGLEVHRAALGHALAEVAPRPIMFHAAASAMFLENPRHHFDMVRIGTLLYGQYPDHLPANLRTLDLRGTFELRSRIVSVHELPRGARIGYGGEFVCARPTRVATVPVGFAHGLGVVPESLGARVRFFAKSLLRGNQAHRGKTAHLPAATIAGQRAPIIGRISMDQCCLDITDLPDADRGTQVALPARRVVTNPSIPRVYEPFLQVSSGDQAGE